MRLLETIRDAVELLHGAPLMPVRCKRVPQRALQKRKFKAGRRRTGRHHCMPPKSFMTRIEIQWAPADPRRLLADVVMMLRAAASQ